MNLLILPVLIPFAASILTVFVRRSMSAQRGLHIVSAAASLAVSLLLLDRVVNGDILVLNVGSWPAPFGITFVADLLSALMVAVTAVVSLAIAVTSLSSIDGERERFGYHGFVLVMLAGVNGAFLTGDLFNLYVWFEVLLMASFVLMTLGNERGQLEGGMKYVTLNLMSSALFLAGVGLLYGATGSLNMAELAVLVGRPEHAGIVLVVAMMFLVAFGIKAAIFPLFFWLPASYHTPPPPVAALFAGLLTKVGVYALLRVFTLLFHQETWLTHTTIVIIAGTTMLTGVLGAAAQSEIRRVLSFHIVSQIGYMILGLGLFSSMAVAGAVFYIVHHIIVKTNLFLVGGVVERMYGTGALKSVGGLYRSSPMLAVLFLIPALSLAGVPPLSGFWSKFILIKAGLDLEAITVTAVALLVSLLTLFSMTKIWAEAFWKPMPEGIAVHPLTTRERWTLLGPIAGLALVTVGIGLGAEPVYEVAVRAAEQLLDPQGYIQAVLGVSP
jgi:multicomponent Na+:H+ antiporter subunit D